MTTSPISAPNAPRRSVKSFDSYEQAERAVDYLADEGFPRAPIRTGNGRDAA